MKNARRRTGWLAGITVKCVVVFATLVLSAASSLSATLCAVTSGDAYTDPPVNSPPLEPPAAQLVAGSMYTLLGSKAQWVQVPIGGRGMWVNRSLFGSTSTCSTAKLPDKSRAMNRTTINISGAGSGPGLSITDETTSSTLAVSDCLCDSGKVCTGPKGGRYCITSAGKKRYGY